MPILENSHRMIDPKVSHDAIGFTNTRGFLSALVVWVSLHANVKSGVRNLLIYNKSSIDS